MSTTVDKSKLQRIVVKVGTSSLTYPSGKIHLRKMEELITVLSDLKNRGLEIILVSSGAIAVGVGKMGYDKRPADLPGKQACAAIGQCELMYLYDKFFSQYHVKVAQILLTKDAFEVDERRENVTNTFLRLLQMDVLPIVNENDSVTVEEIIVGDNDTLSALVALIVQADALIMLSDIDGVYNSDPRKNPDAIKLETANLNSKKVREGVSGAGSSHAIGGMITKFSAASLTTPAGIHTWVMNGEDPKDLYRFFDGEPLGTLFVEGEEDD